ncbi:MAG: hypothetical protein ACRCXB_13985 [Aeromonadaceae bacterium]
MRSSDIKCPLSIVESPYGTFHFEDADGRRIADDGSCSSEDSVTMSLDMGRRIVACVNACRGLPTDELEQKGLVAAVGAELLDLEQQRDDWQKALGAVLATIPNKEIVRVSGTVRDTVAYFKQLHQQRDGLHDAIGLAITIVSELANDENLSGHTKGTLTGLAEGLRMRVVAARGEQ